jgi:hypothetical protein
MVRSSTNFDAASHSKVGCLRNQTFFSADHFLLLAKAISLDDVSFWICVLTCRSLIVCSASEETPRLPISGPVLKGCLLNQESSLVMRVLSKILETLHPV